MWDYDTCIICTMSMLFWATSERNSILHILLISVGGPTQEIKSDEAVLREQVTGLTEQNDKHQKSAESLQGH